MTLPSEQQEEEAVSLEEKIRMLQQQNLPPEKIVEMILQEDLNADINILAETLKLDKMDIGRIKGRVSRLQKRRAEKEAPPAPSETKGVGEPPSPYKGELDVNSILEDILNTHPDIAPRVKAEVMDWAERKGGLQPSEVAWILQSMKGINTTTANIVAAKYSFALQKAQLEGKLQLPPVLAGLPVQPPQPQWAFPQAIPFAQPTITPPQPFPQQTPVQQLPTPTTYQPQQLPTPTAYQPQPLWQYGVPPPQDVRSVVREAVREEMRREEERKPREAEVYVDIQEPVRDAEGHVIIGPDDKPIMKYMRVPASQASQLVSPREDVEMRVLEKLGKYKQLFIPKEELTETKIREIIRQEAPKPTPTPEEKPVRLEDVQKVSSEAAQTAVKQVLEAHEKEDLSERRHREVIAAIERGASTQVVEGYKQDSYRFLGQGMQEGARVIEKKEPLKIIRDILVGPPPKEVEQGARDVLSRLPPEWVVEE